MFLCNRDKKTLMRIFKFEIFNCLISIDYLFNERLKNCSDFCLDPEHNIVGLKKHYSIQKDLLLKMKFGDFLHIERYIQINHHDKIETLKATNGVPVNLLFLGV